MENLVRQLDIAFLPQLPQWKILFVNWISLFCHSYLNGKFGSSIGYRFFSTAISMENLVRQLDIAYLPQLSQWKTGTLSNLTSGVCDCFVSSVMEPCCGMTRNCESQQASRGSHIQSHWNLTISPRVSGMFSSYHALARALA